MEKGGLLCVVVQHMDDMPHGAMLVVPWIHVEIRLSWIMRAPSRKVRIMQHRSVNICVAWHVQHRNC